MDRKTASFDVAVIGAGIAGASLACELSATHRVVLLEREDQPGYHTTGRSAALFSQTYGPPAIRALSRASAAFYDDPPEGFVSGPLLSPRGVMMIARADQTDMLDALASEVSGASGMQRVSAAEARAMVPLLRPGYAAAALYEERARDIDVHALHQGYLRRFRANGGEIRTNAEVLSLSRSSGSWLVETPQGVVQADVVVNAAGAWSDEIARIAGVTPVGLVPKRRTAMIVSAPEGCDPSPWPMAVDIAEEFYLKPDAGRLLLSPADETASPPCDAQPEELDIAMCIDRIERAFDLSVRRIENKWAGLRSFVADKTPVAGFDPLAPGFFWLAGQGGYGIQSAPALARMAAALVAGRSVPADIVDQGANEEDIAPGRLRQAA